jgi:nucleotide-binding universal stress UspA family protein
VTSREKGLVVVGVDGSDAAEAALRFALDEARLRGAALRVIHAWQYGYVGLTGMEGFGLPGASGADLSDLRSAADAALDATMRAVVPADPDVAVERRLIEGAPATVLVDESRHADLLVVGSRGRGGFAGLLLGSVSQQCGQHAACPVVIVRERADDDAATATPEP